MWNKLMMKKFIDRADLVQTIIIIASFAMATIITIQSISTAIMEQSESAAKCLANSSTFISGSSADKCESADPLSGGGAWEDQEDETGNTPEPEKNYDSNELMIDSNLRDFAILAEDYKNKHGGFYPRPNNDELSLLKFKATQTAYTEEYPWNLDYCINPNATEYILTVHLKDSRVMYVSSNNSMPVTFVANLPAPGEEKISPCYSRTPYSAAEHANLNNIGYIRDVFITSGINGKNNNGWRIWAGGQN